MANSSSRYLIIVAAIFTLGPPASALAEILTFDTFPSGAPATDNGMVPLAAAYTVGGISFTVGFDTDGNDVADLAAALEITAGGAPEAAPDGFFNDALGIADKAAPGFESRLGSCFLRHPFGLIGVPFPDFIIKYDATTRPTEAGGEIWDIDGSIHGTEQWLVSAYGAGGGLLGSSLSPLGTFPPFPLDGLPWVWSFSFAEEIDRIEFKFLGDKREGIGLAFDNFAPAGFAAAVPEPASFMLWSVMAAAALCKSRRYARRREI